MLTPQEALLTLNLIPGLGSVRIRNLLDFFGSAEHVLAAPKNLLCNVPRIGPKLAEVIADWRSCTNAQAELETAARFGCRVLTFLDEDYPAALRRMDDAPAVLYLRGELRESDWRRAVAIVGTRQASSYGASMAYQLGRELAEAGHAVISGLARGIDTAAHRGALDGGGRTVAVLGFGHAGKFYPPENAELADRICAGNGAVISEFPMFLNATVNTFPQRNRIVAAWAEATVVAEAPSRSGALHTAGLAAEYGRRVFAVPGAVSSRLSAGCHELIRDGATLCCNAAQLRHDMGWDAPQQMELQWGGECLQEEGTEPLPSTEEEKATTAFMPGSTEHELLQSITAGHDTLDSLCSALGRGAGELNPLLMRLQILGCLLPLPGGRYRCR